jgi:CRISPR-associated endoribonuclease Cas6
MRLKLKFTKPTQPVHVNTQHIINSFIHKLLGNNNEYHDAKSNYAISNLKGGKLNISNNTLSFDSNPFIIVSSINTKFMKKILDGLSNTKDLGYGMTFEGYTPIIKEHYNNHWNNFNTLDPIRLREYNKETNLNRYITINDKDFKDKLKNHIINKFSKIDPTLDFENFDIEIGNGKVKKIYIKDTWNFCSSVQISVYGNKKIKEYLYNYGVGSSTGSGFGTIYQTKNYNVYKF